MIVVDRCTEKIPTGGSEWQTVQYISASLGPSNVCRNFVVYTVPIVYLLRLFPSGFQEKFTNEEFIAPCTFTFRYSIPYHTVPS